MKKKIFICLITLISFGVFAQKTIENPAYEVKASGLTTITKIEYSDTETKVYLHYSFLPKWWTIFGKDYYLEDCDTGKKYAIREVINTPFDKKIWMPKSGEDDFILTYEPFDKGVKKINYGKLILGVSLRKQQKGQKENKVPKKVKKWFKKELSKVEETPLKDFNSHDFFSEKPAKLIGYIKGYDPRLDFKSGLTYIRSSITTEDSPTSIKIHEDGRFEVELPLRHPIYSSFKIKRSWFDYYLEPGQTLAMVLDWKEFLLADRYRHNRHHFKNIELYGPLANINKELLVYNNESLAYNENEFDYKEFSKQKNEILPKKYKEIKHKRSKRTRINLLKFLEVNNVSKKARQILESQHSIEHANTLMNFVSSRKYYAKKDILNKVLQEPIPKDYYNFLKNIDLDNQSLLVNDNFSEFINRLSSLDIFYNNTNTAVGPIDILKYLQAIDEDILKEHVEAIKAIELLNTPEKQKRAKLFFEKYQKRLDLFYKSNSTTLTKIAQENPNEHELQILKKRLKETGKLSPLDEEMLIAFDNTVTPEEKEGVKIFQEKHGEAINSFNKKYSYMYRKLPSKKFFDSKIDKMKEVLETKSDLIFNIIRLQNSIRKMTKDFAPYTDGELKYIKQEISNKNIANYLDIANNNLKAKLEANKTKTGFNVNTVEKTEGDELFESMIAKFKGKVIYVDFWATWCGPCISGIKRMAPLKEEMKDKDVVFLYISAPSSPEKTWKNKIPNIKGEHYRVTQDEWNYLTNKFKVTGIPHYALVNKKGELVNSKLGHMQNSELQKLLETELDK